LSTKTWYGLPVEIEVSSKDFHRVSVPGVGLPHPGVVNWSVRRDRSCSSRWLRLVVGLQAHQAVWEVAAEGYTAFGDSRAYCTPRHLRFRLGYALFGDGMELFGLQGTRFLDNVS